MQNFEIPPGEIEFENTVRDSRGAVALQLGYHEVVTVAPDGQSKVFKRSEYVALGDGRLITAAWIANGKIELAICDYCRYPLPARWWHRLCWWRKPELPSVGLFARDSGDFCVGCSRFVCKAHSRVVSDLSVRCVACARRFWWHSLVHAICYAPVDEDP